MNKTDRIIEQRLEKILEEASQTHDELENVNLDLQERTDLIDFIHVSAQKYNLLVSILHDAGCLEFLPFESAISRMRFINAD